ncbi:MAG: 1-acyl-sn-glycerol-3-phosphate acyltransferase [Paludibacteraceae bacterium]|nr:1-acyl-sn-glycerol-3-phosphate acyltransferase [Paludibacteraceae bacterium]
MSSCLENKRYKMMKVKEDEYIPDVEDTFPEEDPFVHKLSYENIYNEVFDEKYPYLDNSWKWKIGHVWALFRFHFICKWFNPLYFGMRYEGKNNIKKHKKDLENGAVTVCNHAYRWDFISVWGASGKLRIWYPAWADNFQTRDRDNMRHSCGIPVPKSMSAMKKFNEAFDTLHERKEWFHVFPEECRWNNYKPLRPFRKGAFIFAYKYKMPILPMVIVYRERTGLYKLFNKKEPLYTCRVGEPIFPNLDLPRKEAVDELRDRVHAKMCEMAGIIENPWPSVQPNDKG